VRSKTTSARIADSCDATVPDAFVAVRFDVDAADADRWSDALLAVGALSVDASDPAAGSTHEQAILGEPSADATTWWPITRLTALCAAGVDAPALLSRAAHAVERTPPVFETHTVPDRDWVHATQAQFGPIHIGGRVWVVPSWCDPPVRDALNLVVDPGLAFGTGAHPTTRLCLQWLVENVTPDASVLDYGCGSGILAIAAAKLGAKRVVGTDIDTQAILTSIDNAKANGVEARFMHVDALPPDTFSMVVANILANPLRVLASSLAARTHRGGRIALCGILAAQADDVAQAYADGFDVVLWRIEDGWALLSAVRRDA
jgi:ribosomal protein L11 methyltransferase